MRYQTVQWNSIELLNKRETYKIREKQLLLAVLDDNCAPEEIKEKISEEQGESNMSWHEHGIDKKQTEQSITMDHKRFEIVPISFFGFSFQFQIKFLFFISILFSLVFLG